MRKFSASILLVIALLPVGSAQRRRDKDYAFYELQAKPGFGGAQTTESRKGIFLIRKQGKGVEMIDLATGKRLTGEHNFYYMRFIFKNETFLDYEANAPSEIFLEGILGEKRLFGRFSSINLPGRTLQLEANELPSVWACSNHKNPTHTAKSEDDMRALTVQYHCEGWHKLQASDIK